MDTPRGRKPDLFELLEDVDRPDLWDEICRRAQERTRVHVALNAPRRAFSFAPRGALTLAVAAVAVFGGFVAGRHGVREVAAAPVIITREVPAPTTVATVPPSLAVSAPIVPLPSVETPTSVPARATTVIASTQSCAALPEFRDPPGLK